MIRIFFDGGTALNSICVVHMKKLVFIVKKMDKKMTNNELEYMALLEAIEYAIKEYGDLDNVIFCGDSEVIIRQMNGDYEVNAPNLRVIFDEIQDLLGVCGSEQFVWVPRAENLAGVHLEKLRK